MKLKERIHHFLNDQKLKHKLYVIIFESDTPSGKLFDVILIGCILASVLLVIIESLKGLLLSDYAICRNGIPFHCFLYF